MSTAARKARKAAGTKFERTPKIKTHRHPSERSTPRQVDIDQLIENMARSTFDSPEAKAARDLPLDPKPWRIGRRRFTAEQTADDPISYEFSPRKQYQQDEFYYA